MKLRSKPDGARPSSSTLHGTERAPTSDLLSVSGGASSGGSAQPSLPVYPVTPQWNLTSDEAGLLVCVDSMAAEGAPQTSASRGTSTTRPRCGGPKAARKR